MTIPFSPAGHFTTGRNGKKPRIIVVHTMETPETKKRARLVWNWFAGKTAPQASAHYCVDATEVLQSVKDEDTAWAVGDFELNQCSLSIELAGSASQTSAQWADAYSEAELELTGKLCADLSKKYSIPVVRLTPADILAGKSGFCGHVDITVAKAVKGGHTDPGKNFPWMLFLSQVKSHL